MKISIIPMFISLYLFCLIPVHSSFWLQIAAWPWVVRTVSGNLHKADSWVYCCCCSCSCSCSCCSWSCSCTCVAALPDMCPVLVPLTVIAQVQTVLRLRPTFIVNSLYKYYRNIILYYWVEKWWSVTYLNTERQGLPTLLPWQWLCTTFYLHISSESHTSHYWTAPVCSELADKCRLQFLSWNPHSVVIRKLRPSPPDASTATVHQQLLPARHSLVTMVNFTRWITRRRCCCCGEPN